MRTTLWIALSLLLASAAPATAGADELQIRKELDAQYAKLAEAHDRKDVAAIAALKTSDFHAIFPDGEVGDAVTMGAYTKQFLEMNQPPYGIKITIRELKVSENGLIAVAVVFQEASRYRDLEGKRRKVDTSVTQNETWSKTPEGWKLKLVDSVRDQKRYVDGKRVDPTKPYNPNDPPFAPEETGAKKP